MRLTEAQREQMVLTYQQTIQGAFRDVSNALVCLSQGSGVQNSAATPARSARTPRNCRHQRFKAGTTDYLEVLTNETNAFSAELGLAQAEGNELIALVQIYIRLSAEVGNSIRL